MKALEPKRRKRGMERRASQRARGKKNFSHKILLHCLWFSSEALIKGRRRECGVSDDEKGGNQLRAEKRARGLSTYKHLLKMYITGDEKDNKRAKDFFTRYWMPRAKSGEMIHFFPSKSRRSLRRSLIIRFSSFASLICWVMKSRIRTHTKFMRPTMIDMRQIL